MGCISWGLRAPWYHWSLSSREWLKTIVFFGGQTSRFFVGSCSHIAWQFDIWTITVGVTANWHNCQLFLCKEFLLLFPWKPQQPENCVLSINHKALTRCSSVSWVRASSLFRERQRLSTETTPPPPPFTLCHRCRAPPKSHFLLYVALIGGCLS